MRSAPAREEDQPIGRPPPSPTSTAQHRRSNGRQAASTCWLDGVRITEIPEPASPALLDAAVPAAYAATDPAGDWREVWADDWFGTGAGQPIPEGHPLTDRRAETDQHVLANLLRLNLARAEGAH